MSESDKALLARIDERRDRLYRDHGKFPDSGAMIREFRDG